MFKSLAAIALLVFLSSAHPAWGQHCGFDFTGILRVRPVASASDTLAIMGLKLTLDEDSIGTYETRHETLYQNGPVAAERSGGRHAWEYRNQPADCTYVVRDYTSGNLGGLEYNFGFAARDYIALTIYLPPDYTPDATSGTEMRDAPLNGSVRPGGRRRTLTLEDTMRLRPGGQFARVRLDVPPAQVFPLCTNFPWDVIRPMVVVMKRVGE